MRLTNVSACERFVVIDGLHLDRTVFDALAGWAADHGLGIQDAIQLALCAFNERNAEQSAFALSSGTLFRVQDSRAPAHAGPQAYR